MHNYMYMYIIIPYNQLVIYVSIIINLRDYASKTKITQIIHVHVVHIIYMYVYLW